MRTTYLEQRIAVTRRLLNERSVEISERLDEIARRQVNELCRLAMAILDGDRDAMAEGLRVLRWKERK